MGARHRIAIGLVISLFIIGGANNALAERAEGTEARVSNSIDSYNPAIYGDWIAWDNRRAFSPAEIYLYNISSGEELLLTPIHTMTSEYPAIYKDRLVWNDWRQDTTGENMFSGIYMYNISSGENKLLIETYSFSAPVIYNDVIVWQDERYENPVIYMYDISTGEEQQITTHNSDQANPVIHDDAIVWQDNRSGSWDIYMYAISTGEERQITREVSDQTNPAIYGDKIVWQDYREGNWDIYMYDLSSEKEIRLTTSESDQIDPAICGDRIVWVDGYLEILMYDMSTGKELQITDWEDHSSITEAEWRGQPAIYENRVVWSDGRNGMDHHDIYMFTLEEQVPEEVMEGFVEDPLEATGTQQDLATDSEDSGTQSYGSMNTGTTGNKGANAIENAGESEQLILNSSQEETPSTAESKKQVENNSTTVASATDNLELEDGRSTPASGISVVLLAVVSVALWLFRRRT
ncbi:cell surface protein [Methanolobus psychrophilus R15]|nr:cell surface protein [Methanolobus psychrophilus R15]